MFGKSIITHLFKAPSKEFDIQILQINNYRWWTDKETPFENHSNKKIEISETSGGLQDTNTEKMRQSCYEEIYK